jgi:response regulator RpfG family c-di-GMP phosphodiesterase
MVLEFETNLIVDEGIRKGTRELLDMFAEKIKEQPTSLSGKHHLRDFIVEKHLQRATWFANELCREFNIQGRDRDIILSATLLHDIGNYQMSRKGNVEGVVEYYEATGWGRIAPLDQHPLIGKDIILKSTLPSKELIADLVSKHMSHWHRNCPQPDSLFAYIVCIADYLTSQERVELL